MIFHAGTLIYPYIIPMLLGRSFDLFRAQVGVDIFSQNTIKDPIRIHRSFVNSDFRLIRNDTEAKRFLGLSEDVSLRVKAGILNIGATGEYLKDIQTRDDYLEILVKSSYETFTETLHGSADPIEGWDLLSPSSLGTHYVRSVTYGGLLLASLRLHVISQAEKEALEKYLASNVSFTEVAVSVQVGEGEKTYRREINSFEEKLKSMMYDVKQKMGTDVSLSIKYYSTVTAPHVPQDVLSFLSVLEAFPAEAAKVNGGFGVPLTVELVPLHDLSSRLTAFKPSSSNSLLQGALEKLEDQFNDLLLAHKSMKKMPNKTKDKKARPCKMGELGTEVQDKMAVFNSVIQNLDTSSPQALGLSQRAIQAYEQKPARKRYYDLLKNEDRACNPPDTNTTQAEPQGALAPLDPPSHAAAVLERFGHLAELAMANALCASANKFAGAFMTLRRNCSIAEAGPDAWTCSRVCRQLQVGSSAQDRGECVSVVATQLETEGSLGAGALAGPGKSGNVVGAQTANLGRSVCEREACYREFCCCRLSKMKLL